MRGTRFWRRSDIDFLSSTLAGTEGRPYQPANWATSEHERARLRLDSGGPIHDRENFRLSLGETMRSVAKVEVEAEGEVDMV